MFKMTSEIEDFYQRMNALGVTIPVIDGFEYRYSVTSHCLVYRKEGDSISQQIKVKEEDLINYSDRPELFKRALLKTFSKMKSQLVIRDLEPNRYAGGYITRHTV